MTLRLIAAWLLFVVSPAVLAGPIERIEPPFWWTGFEHRELQLMIYGNDIGHFDVSIQHPGVSLTRVERVANSNYLFLYIDIADDATAGAVPISFQNGDQGLVREYELRERNPNPDHARGFSPADTIYLVTPDRFVNGDPDNDTIEGLGDPLDHGIHSRLVEPGARKRDA
jgi:hypothetical protein